MTHLTRQELEQFWRDAQSPHRDRIIAHLAQCDDCGALYGDLMDRQPVEPASGVRSLTRVGRRAYRPARQRRATWLPWPAVPLAAAAAAVLFVALVLPVLRHQPAPAIDDPAVRGSGLQLLEPVGETTPPVRFRWASAVAPASFRVEIQDGDGGTVVSLTTTREEVELPARESVWLMAGERYTWRVDALDEAGNVLTRSPSRSFVVAPSR